MATLKVRSLHPKWRCLISGKFAEHVPLVSYIASAVEDVDNPSYSDITKACTNAFIAENKRLAEEGILSRFGMSLEEFLKSREDIGDSLYERTWADVSRAQIGCQLLVCGFSGNLPHVFIVENPNSDHLSFVTNLDFPGFGAIGSGSYLAESTLYAFQQNPARTLDETIYITLLAKFSSESATDVGTKTYLSVFDSENDCEIENAVGMVEEVRKDGKRNGNQKLSPTSPAL